MTAGPTQADGFGTRVCRLTTGLDGRTGYILEVRQYGAAIRNAPNHNL